MLLLLSPFCIEYFGGNVMLVPVLLSFVATKKEKEILNALFEITIKLHEQIKSLNNLKENLSRLSLKVKFWCHTRDVANWGKNFLLCKK